MRTKRSLLDDPLDWVRFKLDTFPRNYQPLPGEGDGLASGRAAGTMSRWAAMEPVVDALRPATALDIGANLGWFTFALSRKGVRTIAVERHAPYARAILYSAKKLHDDRVSLLVTDLDVENGVLLPEVDCILFLSVWHHVVREEGLEYANRLLRLLWDRCQKVLFFETGQTEMSSAFGLPDMGSEPAAWLAEFLEEVCPGGHVEVLGEHQVPDVCGGRAARHLFAVRRSAEG